MPKVQFGEVLLWQIFNCIHRFFAILAFEIQRPKLILKKNEFVSKNFFICSKIAQLIWLPKILFSMAWLVNCYFRNTKAGGVTQIVTVVRTWILHRPSLHLLCIDESWLWTFTYKRRDTYSKSVNFQVNKRSKRLSISNFVVQMSKCP